VTIVCRCCGREFDDAKYRDAWWSPSMTRPARGTGGRLCYACNAHERHRRQGRIGLDAPCRHDGR
jgi:hypothetical protein